MWTTNMMIFKGYKHICHNETVNGLSKITQFIKYDIKLKCIIQNLFGIDYQCYFNTIISTLNLKSLIFSLSQRFLRKLRLWDLIVVLLLTNKYWSAKKKYVYYVMILFYIMLLCKRYFYNTFVILIVNVLIKV